jgi:plasmid stabilization system protein ParE
MKLRWTNRARQDLLQIGTFIAQDNRPTARRWVERLRQKARDAAQAPLAGRIVPELGRDEIREVLLRSYRIIYLVRNDNVTVLTVFEGHRLLREEDIPTD